MAHFCDQLVYAKAPLAITTGTHRIAKANLVISETLSLDSIFTVWGRSV